MQQYFPQSSCVEVSPVMASCVEVGAGEAGRLVLELEWLVPLRLKLGR